MCTSINLLDQKYKVWSETSNIFNLQRAYFSNKTSLTGKHVLLKTSEGTYLCKILYKRNIPKNVCFLDKSVSLQQPLADDIKILKLIKYIKVLQISIILNTVKDREHWLENQLKLIPFLKQTLQILTLVGNSNVILPKNNLGISCLVVHSIGNLEAGKVVNNTKIAINDLISLERYQQSKQVKLSLCGLEEPCDKLQKYLICRKSVSKPLPQVLIIGPPGSGKKTIIKKVAYDCEAVLVQIDCTELCLPGIGVTESLLREKFEYAKLLAKEGLVVLNVLQAEILCRKPNRVLFQFNALLDSVSLIKNLVVTASTINSNYFHESVKTSTRFHYQIYVGVPTRLQRIEILKMFLIKYNLPETTKTTEIAEITNGYTISDLSLLVSKTHKELRNSKLNFLTLIKINVTKIEPSTLRGELGVIKSLEVTPLGGLENIQNSLIQMIQWPLIYAEEFKKMNLNQPSGVLLYGPPGCAKTSLARTIAASSKVSFLAVSAADLYSPYVGDAEHIISHLFQRARAAAPCVVFIDEIDSLVGARGGKKSVQDRILTCFLTEMDGVGINTEAIITSKVVVIAATNRPQALDSALIRPGRFDKLIYVPPPNLKDRLKILNVLVQNIPLDNGVNLDHIATKTEFFSGADLSNLSREAAFNAMVEEGDSVNNIKMKHWIKALEQSKPSLTQDQIKWYNQFSFS